MKNMGFHDLRLVKPPELWKPKARKMATAAFELLEKARVYPSLSKAVNDAGLVIGTTRRIGAKRGSFLGFKEALRKIRQTAVRQNVAIVFGKESKGLSNRHLDFCDWLVSIPANPQYPSVNLAQAVMLMVFSLLGKRRIAVKSPDRQFVTKKEFESIIQNFQEMIMRLNYHPEVVGRIHMTFRRFLKRGGVLPSEAQMIKGVTRRICERIPKPPVS